MREINYHGRRAIQIENDLVRATLTVEGGHLAELLHKESGVDPLWKPDWKSIEPSTYDPAKHPEYGGGIEAQLLSGIFGHNLCLDVFGAPSRQEIAAGIGVHGEASVVPYEIAGNPAEATLSAVLPKAQLRFTRRLSLQPGSDVLRFQERVENLAAFDRPIAWTEHVTLGPPFLEQGRTQFRLSATRSKVIESFNDGKGAQQDGAEFDWPNCPRKDSGTDDLRVFPAAAVSGGFTAHLMDLSSQHAWFAAWSPRSRVAVGYVWKRANFPWLARWEENHLRTEPPWNGRGMACGMEFGVSPMVESRRQMVERASLFGTPTFRWIAAKETLVAEYCAVIRPAEAVPAAIKWDGAGNVQIVM